MGGRGARYGISAYKIPHDYGTQYKTVYEYGNVKFVEKTGTETLMETMTPGRTYVQIGGDEPIRIILNDNQNKRTKVIEKDKSAGEWHVHYGYEHSEYSETNHSSLSYADKKYLERILEIWHNRNRR